MIDQPSFQKIRTALISVIVAAGAVFALVPALSFAAIAVNSTMPSQVGQAQDNGNLSFGFTNTAGTILFTCATAGSAGETVTGVTYGGNAMTLIATSTTDTAGVNAETTLWYLLSPPTGANSTAITVAGSGGPDNYTIGGDVSFTGNAISSPIAQSVSAKGRGTSATVGLTGTTAGNYLIDCADAGSSISTSNTTLNFEDNIDGNSFGNNAASSYGASGGGTVTMGYTGDGSDQWGIVAAELKAQTAPPPVINSFSPSPSSIAYGSSSVLSWNVSNASSVSITAFGYAGFTTSTLVGSTSVSPSLTTSYTLTASSTLGGALSTTTAVTVTGGPSTISFVQASSSTAHFNSSLISSVSTQFGGTVTSGDMIAVELEYLANNSEDTVDATGCSDTNNPASNYQEAMAVVNPVTEIVTDIWYVPNAVGGIKPTVTCTFNPQVNWVSMAVEEYSGVATVSPLDTMAAAETNDNGPYTAWTTGSSTVRTSYELVIGSFADGSSTSFTAGSGFAKRVDLGGTSGMMVEDGIQTVPGATAATASSAGGVLYETAAMATFRGATQSLPAGPLMVQQTSTSAGDSATISATFPNSVTSGDLITVLADWGDAGVQSVTSTCTGAFTQADSATNPGVSTSTDWYAVANASGACTVTANSSIATTGGEGQALSIAEISGIATSATLDTHSANGYTNLTYPGSSADAWTSGSATTAANGDYIWGGMVDTNDNWFTQNGGTGETLEQYDNGQNFMMIEDKIQPTAGSVQSTFTNPNDTNATGNIFMMAFKEASGTPTTPTNLSAVASSFTQVSLAWATSTDELGIAGYKIYRGGTQVGTSTVPSYTDGGLAPGTGYAYTVSSYDFSNNTSTQSSPARVVTASPSTGGIYLVQGSDGTSEYNENFGAYTNVAAQFKSNVTTGDAIIATVEYNSAGTDLVSGCRDTNNATSSYKEAVSSYNTALAQGVDIWYATGVAGGTKPTVTCGFTGNYTTSQGWDALGIQEFAGITSVATVDATSTYDSEGVASSTWSAGSVTTTATNDLIFSAFVDPYSSATTTPFVSTTSFSGGAGYSPRINDGMATGMLTEDMLRAATGTVTATATSSKAWPQTNATVAFKAATSSYVGVLDSITYDTGDTNGAQLDAVEWTGTLQASTTVEFQFAVGNTATGTWTTTFTGPDGTSNTYFVPTGPGVALALIPTTGSGTMFTNYRYFRYRVTLVATASTTPILNNVIVDWSP